jgi:carboxypeptidase T
MISLLIPLFLALPQALLSLQEPKDLVRIYPNSAAEFDTLSGLLSDLDDHYRPADGSVIAYATDAEQDSLFSAGISFAVEIEDLSAWYAHRAAQAGTRAGVGSMGGFRTLAELEQEMDRLAAAFPHRISQKFSIGQSLQGRSIWAFRLSTTPQAHDPAKPTAWYDALHHAREPMSAESLVQFANLLCESEATDVDASRIIQTRNLIFIPCVNPDGYEINRQSNPNGGGMWRKNARASGGSVHGVDLNRNYDYAWGPGYGGSSSNPNSETYHGTAGFSEPETAAIRDYMAQFPPSMALSCHTYSNLWLFPWGYDTIYAPDDEILRHYARMACEENGWQYGTGWEVLYVANGVAFDYYYAVHGALAYTPEIGGQQDGFWPDPSRIPALFEAVVPGYSQTARFSGAAISVAEFIWQPVQGDGDEIMEPGETWNLRLVLANQGSQVGNGFVEMISNHADLSVSGGALAFDVVANSTQQTDPFQVTFSASAPVGQEIGFTLALDYEGYQDFNEADVILGRPRLLIHDNMEFGGAGWKVSDNTNYSWELAVPQATENNGQVVQPGVDNPFGDGSLCWVTGAAAGSSVGENDVDGVTVLLTPIFDVDSFDTVFLSYARWFANLPGNASDDVFLAEVSNDGGQTWHPLEEVGNRNEWQEMRFPLHDAIALSAHMRLRFTISDDPNNDLTEGCLDDIHLETWSDLPTLGIWGSNEISQPIRIFLDGTADSDVQLLAAIHQDNRTIPGIAGDFLLGRSWRTVFYGNLGATGRITLPTPIPNMVALRGIRVYLQAVVGYGTQDAAFTNLVILDIAD